MVVAKLDHSRVLVTKFHQTQPTLKGRSAGQRHTHRQTDSQTSRWVFTARLHPQFRMPQFPDLWSESAERCGRNISGSAHLCRPLMLQRRHAASTDAARYDRRDVAGMANFKMYLLRKFCWNRVEFFTIHRRYRRKNDGPEF